MVQVINNPAASLGDAAAQFAAGLQKFMKPNHDFQVAMQKAIGGNPALAQQLADLEYNAPGSLDNLGFGDLGRVIAQVPESAESAARRATRGDTVETAINAAATAKAQSGISLQSINDAIHLLKTNPEVKADVVLRTLGLQTTGQKALETANTNRANAETKRIETEQPALEAASELRYKALQATVDKYPELHGMDPMRIVRDMMAGKEVPNLQSYLMLPGAQEALNHAQSIMIAEQQADARALAQAQLDEYRQARLDAKGERMSEEQRRSLMQAGSFQRQAKGGTLASWQVVLDHPDQVEALQERMKDEKYQPTPAEKNILYTVELHQDLMDHLESKTLKDLNLNIRQAYATAASAIRPDKDGNVASPEAIGIALTPLNNVLAEAGKKTGQTVIAKFGVPPKIGSDVPESHWYGDPNPQLYFVGADGKRLDGERVLAGQPEVVSKDAKLDAETLSFITQYKGANDKDKVYNLEWIKKNKPKLYERVNAQLNKK